MTKIRLIATAGVAAMALAVSGCGSSSGSGSSGGSSGGGEYHVIVMGGLSTQGVLADNALTSVNSAKAGVDLVNESGGIGGKKVTIEELDDAGDPTTAVTKLRAAINSKKPDLVLNSGPSTIAQATLPILNQAGILSFNIGPTADSSNPASFPLNFDLSPGPSDQIAAFTPYFKEKGYTSVGILHGNSAYGESYGKAAQASFTSGGVKVTANEEYDAKALDMTAQLEKIKATNPDALLLDAYGAPLGYIVKGVDKLGWDIPIVGNTSVAATGLVSKEAPDGLVGSPEVRNLVMQVYKSTKHDPAASLTNEAVTKMLKYGPIKASLILAYNYDALPLVQTAAASAGSTDAKAVAKALADPSITSKAKTAIISGFNFTDKAHHPTDVSGEFAFISPSVLKDGQFQ